MSTTEEEPRGAPRDALIEILSDLQAHLSWAREAGIRRVIAPSAALPPSTPSSGPIVAASSAAVAGEPPGEARARVGQRTRGSAGLDAVRDELGECERCGLGAGRTNLVFGVGDPNASIVFVGEGPGEREDAMGEPFVGPAGQLLDRMIKAMGYEREAVYICNVVKCRPPGNRDPNPEEVETCEPFLKAQIAAIAPTVIVGLGRFAVQCLLGDPGARISAVRGRWFTYEDIDLMPTFHPAYLLRNPAEKALAWSDLKQVMARLERPAQ